MKSLFTTTALGLVLAVSPALAQSSDQTQTPTAQPETQQKSPGSGSMNQDQGSSLPGATDTEQSQGAKPETSTEDTAQTDTSGMKSAEAADVTGDRASELIGATVENTRGESVGEINDIIIAEDGSASAVLIGVGGFLGLGEKSIAVKFADLNIKRSENALAVTVAMSSEELESLPAYKGEESGYGSGTQEQGSEGAPMNEQQGSPQGGATQPQNQ